MMFSNMLSVVPHIQSGRLKALAVTSLKRTQAAPKVPTMDESGVPGFESGTWYVMMAPSGIPREIVERLNVEINRIVQLPEVKNKLAALGAEPMNGSPQETRAFLNREIAKWAKVIKNAQTKIE